MQRIAWIQRNLPSQRQILRPTGAQVFFFTQDLQVVVIKLPHTASGVHCQGSLMGFLSSCPVGLPLIKS